MGSYIAKWVGGKLIQDKILKERLENKFGVDDPYFEQVPATRLNGTPTGKFKKVRKALPPGISVHDADVLNKVKRRAYRLDMAFGSFLGIKFAYLVIRTAKQVEGGLPSGLLLTMYFWLVVDLIIGFVPFVGDIADALVLANTRNAAALENYLREKGKKNLRASGQPIPASDPSDPAEFDRLHTESPGTSRPSRATRAPTNISSSQHAPQTDGVAPMQHLPSQPAPARVHDDRQDRPRRGFFGFGSQRSRPTDVEAGNAPAN
ncbi:hypothetical protein E0Z10_g8675 [Xylaria hypoxylon]|uniref:DUF4112 domain-containing protein n=1 Tax=Xylaria hypoxylon TaxID=37992 RepID=A0A4Z0YAQ8_9PEZI|nr:hypothetical protein E0Z10_g8675 [Xylaria hypoxylon]